MKSYNGWTASPTLKTRVIEPVKGVKLRIADNDNVATVFTYLCQQYHERVDDITKPHPKDDWGYAFRANKNNPNELSNHASATAVDMDATEHPNGVATKKTYTAAQIAEVHEILKELQGVVRWGGDYRVTADGMHFEIAVRPGELQDVARKIRRGEIGPKKPHDKLRKQSTIVNEVIAGKWGNGDERVRRLKRAGYNPSVINAAVKKKLAARKRRS